MTGISHNVLVCTDVVDDKGIRALSKYSKVYKLADFTEDRLNEVLPSIDCLLVFSWPSQLTSQRLQEMTSLRFIQSILAGVNHIPFASLNESVIVGSNAGAYSDEVAEYAWALLLSAAKIMNAQRLSEMKKDGILVNVARGELVDEKAMYEHLVANPNFRYATDVWWYRENRESLKTDFPFLSLPNFIGTPHVSGPSGLA